MKASIASDLVILIPAAGASSRMQGRDKLLEDIDGAPLLRVVAQRALATGAPVVVVLSEGRDARRAALADLELSCITLPDHAGGMAASIRAGMGAVPDGCAGVMILPADMPELKTEYLEKVARQSSCNPGAVVRAVDARGAAGHPVVFPPRLFAALRALPDGEGARGAMAGEEIIPCPLPGAAALTDLDTQDDWAAWRARQNSTG